jgi:hypothetical protein
VVARFVTTWGSIIGVIFIVVVDVFVLVMVA